VALHAQVLHFDRLSASERQPYSLAHRSALTWDGRLDNREDLCLILQQTLGADHSDAAIVAAAYTRWGLDALPKLIGDWALAIWDDIGERVILARDYAGGRPLYYFANADRLVWATDLEALATSEDLLGMPDNTFMATYLTTGVPPGLTPFTGAIELRAGHTLIGTRTGATAHRHWDYVPSTLRYRRPEDYATHLRYLLTEAVRVRLRATRTVWADLSGGWDSSSIVCLASRLIQQGCVETPRLQPISDIVEAPLIDERSFMTAVEEWCGLTTVTFPYPPPFPSFSDMLGHILPVSMDNAYAKYVAIDTARDQIVLRGDLGDLVMGQSGFAQIAMFEPLHEGHVLQWLGGFQAYARARGRPLLWTLFRALLLTYGPRRGRRLFSSFVAQPALTAIYADSNSAVLSPTMRKLTASSLVDAEDSPMGFSRLKQPIVLALRKWADKPYSGAPNLRITRPYTHRPLVELSLSVPRTALFDPLATRAGMKRALADVLPPQILARTTKSSFTVPMHRAARAYARTLPTTVPLIDHIKEWQLTQRDVVEPHALVAAIRHTQGSGELSGFLHRCLHLEAWLRTLSTVARKTRSAKADNGLLVTGHS
jgi:asparagine synthase (glutamine-hydrolysing)